MAKMQQGEATYGQMGGQTKDQGSWRKLENPCPEDLRQS